MKKEEMENLTTSIQEKLGKEASAKIADDLGKLITDNAQMNKEIENRNSQITKLKQDKENLIATNGNLLQQVAMGEDFSSNIISRSRQAGETEEKKKPFSFKDCFDEKGNFKK